MVWRVAVLVAGLLAAVPAEAGGKGGGGGSGPVHVNGYVRKDGTYVAPHMRSAPDGNFRNNWSTVGNVNPYTGEPGTKVVPKSTRSNRLRRSSLPDAAEAPLPPPDAQLPVVHPSNAGPAKAGFGIVSGSSTEAQHKPSVPPKLRGVPGLSCENPLDWDSAREHIGRTRAIAGRVVAVTKSPSNTRGNPTWIEVGAPFPSIRRLSLVIWGNHRANFPTDLQQLIGTRPCILGEVKGYKGVAQIELKSPDQLQFRDDCGS